MVQRLVFLLVLGLFGLAHQTYSQSLSSEVAVEVIGEGLLVRSSPQDRYRQDFYITLKNIALDSGASSVLINSRPEHSQFFGNYISSTPRLIGVNGLFQVHASGASLSLSHFGDQADEIATSLQERGIRRLEIVVMDAVDSTLSPYSQVIQETGIRSLLRARETLERLLAQGIDVRLHILNHMRSATQAEVISDLSAEARLIWCRALL